MLHAQIHREAHQEAHTQTLTYYTHTRLGGDAGDEEVGDAPAVQPGLQVGVVEGALGALEQRALPLQQQLTGGPEIPCRWQMSPSDAGLATACACRQ